MDRFSTIAARAALRKGGAEVVASLLPEVAGNAALARVPDDRFLAAMMERIFSAGFVWSVIKAKWPGFEAAFLGFQPDALLFQPDEFWHDLAGDTRIVRHGAKIMAVRDNAGFIRTIAQEHGSFGAFLAGWPGDDQIGLLALLARRGSRLGGMTGQYFLRFAGWDSFILSRDVCDCLGGAGVALSEKATSKRDLAAAQAAFTVWHGETGLPYTHLSRICAMSAGANTPVETIRSYMDDGGEE